MQHCLLLISMSDLVIPEDLSCGKNIRGKLCDRCTLWSIIYQKNLSSNVTPGLRERFELY